MPRIMLEFRTKGAAHIAAGGLREVAQNLRGGLGKLSEALDSLGADPGAAQAVKDEIGTQITDLYEAGDELEAWAEAWDMRTALIQADQAPDPITPVIRPGSVDSGWLLETWEETCKACGREVQVELSVEITDVNKETREVHITAHVFCPLCGAEIATFCRGFIRGGGIEG